MRYLASVIIAIMVSCTSGAMAQDKKTTFNIRAGFSIGGTTPIGLPESIRKIENFNPGLLLSLEGGLIHQLSEGWAIGSGLRFEQKGMTTEAVVKNYYTTFNAGDRSGNESVTGYYSGNVTTSVKNGYLTLPVHIVRSLSNHFSVRGGGFVSLLIEKRFTGSAINGYLRNLTPIGEKEEINEAAYDFSNQVRNLNAGVELGINYRINSHLDASINLNWALTPLLKSNQQSIDFKMYNIFVSPGIAYKF